MTMKKSLGKRLISGVTSGLLAVTYALPSGLAPIRALAAEDGVASDGLPIVNTPYEESLWNRNNPLGVAGDFHLFGFESVESWNHVNGNVATPVYIIQNGYTSPNQKVGRLLNVVTKDIFWRKPPRESGNIVNEPDEGKMYAQLGLAQLYDWYLPVNYEIWGNDIPAETREVYNDETGENEVVVVREGDERVQVKYPTIFNPSNDSRYTGVNIFPGKKADFPDIVADYAASDERTAYDEGGPFVGPMAYIIGNNAPSGTECYFAHAGDNFIDFAALKTYYENMSNDYGSKGPRTASTGRNGIDWDGGDDSTWDNPNPGKGTLTLYDEGENVLNIKASELDKYHEISVENINYENGQYKGNQTLIVNIDLEGLTDVAWNPNWSYTAKDGTKLNDGAFNGEKAVIHGTNILYNFYNGAPDNGTKISVTGTKIPLGCVLAPDTEFEVTQINGNVIANKITAKNETHMAYFLNPFDEQQTNIDISVQKNWSDGNANHTADEVKVTLYRLTKSGVSDPASEITLENQYNDLVRFITEGDLRNCKFRIDGQEYMAVSENDGSVNYHKNDEDINSRTELFTPQSNGDITSTLADGEYEFSVQSRSVIVAVAGGKITSVTGDPIATQIIGTKTINTDNWNETWDGLPKESPTGYVYYYYAVEENVKQGYTVSYEGNGAAGGNRTITVTNTSDEAVNKLKFVKLSDVLTVDEVTDETVTFKSAEQRLIGAQFTLALITPNDSEAKLSSGVKSNLDSNVKGKPTYNDDTITWTTIDEDIVFEGLPDGTYRVTETAPEGYQPVKEFKFRLDSGKPDYSLGLDEDSTNLGYSIDNSDVHNGVITVNDDVYSISLRKVDENDIPVPGALLRLTSTSGADMTKVKAHDTQFFTANGYGWNMPNSNIAPYRLDLSYNEIKNVASDSAAAFEWYSIGSAVIFTGLPEGTYSLEEVSAPAGYSRDAKVRNFTIARDENGRLTASGDVKNEDGFDKINDIVNKKQTVSVSKNDMNATVIDRAEFRLTKKDGTKLGKLTRDYEDARGYCSTGIGLTSNSKTVTVKYTSEGMGYTLRGNTFNNVKIDGEAVNTTAQQNVYEIKGSAKGDTIEITR